MDMDQGAEEEEENLLLLFSQSTSERAKRQMLQTQKEHSEAALSRHSKGTRGEEEGEKASQMHATQAAIPPFTNSERAAAAEGVLCAPAVPSASALAAAPPPPPPPRSSAQEFLEWNVRSDAAAAAQLPAGLYSQGRGHARGKGE